MMKEDDIQAGPLKRAMRNTVKTPISSREFRGARIPIFFKISFFLLMMGLVPLTFFLLFITSSYSALIHDFISSEFLDAHKEAIAQELADFEKAVEKLQLLIALLAFIFLVAFFLGTILFSRSLTIPLQSLTRGISELRKGKYNISLPLKTNDELGALLRDFNLMVEQLKDLRERERAISKAKSELITLTAHQFRTPLSGIKWSLDMAREKGFDGLRAEQRELLEGTYQSTERLIRLVADVLDTVRVGEGKFGKAYGEYRVETTVEEAVNEVRKSAKQRRIDIQYLAPSDPIAPIRYDRERVKLALANILANAIAYSNADDSIVVLVREDDGRVEITVQDNGIGIPKRDLDKLFTKFFRGSNVDTLRIPGTGLGLCIVKTIIEDHGGEIRVKSKEGQGTAVSLYLPRKRDLNAQEAETPFRELVEG